MKIPKKLKIGAHTYQIKFIEGLDKCGSTNRDKQVILVGEEMPQTQREVTLIHEILHAINNEIDHALLDSLAEQMYAVLKDNKLIK